MGIFNRTQPPAPASNNDENEPGLNISNHLVESQTSTSHEQGSHNNINTQSHNSSGLQKSFKHRFHPEHTIKHPDNPTQIFHEPSSQEYSTSNKGNTHNPTRQQEINQHAYSLPLLESNKPIRNPFQVTNASPSYTNNNQNLPPAQSNTIGYGINSAIKLLRELPDTGDIAILMAVVKKTLETTGIKIKDIIDDAQKKKANMQKRLQKLDLEIQKLQNEIQTRTHEIGSLSHDIKEIEQVQELLELAELPKATKFAIEDND